MPNWPCRDPQVSPSFTIYVLQVRSSGMHSSVPWPGKDLQNAGRLFEMTRSSVLMLSLMEMSTHVSPEEMVWEAAVQEGFGTAVGLRGMQGE